VVNRVHVLVLRIYRRLPAGVRRWLIRVVSPSFTVGAICLIEREDDAVLLVRQVYRARWGLPGGLLKRREDPVAAVRREVLEEIGVEIELTGEPTMVVESRPQRVDLVYSARLADPGGPAPAPRSPEILDVRWFPRDALPELQHETVTALVALARSTRAPRASAVVPPAPTGPVRDHA
jgi:8-oxo-dGTP diphosphatase